MATIVPSILETTKDGFLATYAKEIKLPGVSRIQVDFGDGIFVPNQILDIAEIESLTPTVHWEAHLMINEPQDFLDYQICGFKTIIVHYEAYKTPEDLKRALSLIKAVGLEPSLCLKNETPVTVAVEFSSVLNHFQLMSVKPGYQGTPFLANTYERIKELRSLLPNAIIEVDGGINADNVKQLANTGADLLILGSSITKVPNMQEAFEKIQNELNKSFLSKSE
jgi:ribulose-phosphate 3-epimerase